MNNKDKYPRRQENHLSSVVFGKVPPQAIDLEGSILGALMIDRDAFDNIQSLQPDDFYDERHRLVFSAILNLHRTNKPVDLLTVTDELRKMGQLEDAGGPFYVTNLTNHVASAAHIEHHCRLVQQKSLQRKLILIGSNAVHNAYDDTIDIFEQYELVETQLTEANSIVIGVDIKSMSEVSTEIDKAREEQRNQKKRTGVPSSFKDIKGKIGQYNNGDLIILAARASMGKTAMAVSEILEVAKMGVPIGLVSMEMNRSKIYLRLVAAEAGITMRKIEEMNNITSEEANKIALARATVNNLPIFIDDTPNPTLLQFRARCLRLKRKYNVEMIFADHLGKITIPELMKDLYTMTTQIARAVKALAYQMDIPLIMLTQLSRKTEGRKDMRPMLSDLKDSGAIEEEADLVGLLYRPEYYKDQGIANMDFTYYRGEKISTIGYGEVNWAKNRNGPTGIVPLTYVNYCMRFEDYAPTLVRDFKNKADKAEETEAPVKSHSIERDLFGDTDGDSAEEPPF